MQKIENRFIESDYDAIEFKNQINPRIRVCPMYFKLGFSPSPRMFGRRTLLERLLKALNFLPSEYGYLVWDVYRPREVQGKLFDWMRKEIGKKSPHLNDQENYTETKKYMSVPSQVGEDYCPPHLSGGAIDLTLFEMTEARELEMGTPFDDCSDRAHNDYFDRQLELSLEDQNIKKRRDLLRMSMENVGFTSYQYEWWHFDIGDIFWSRITGLAPVFGPLFGNQEWPESIDKEI